MASSKYRISVVMPVYNAEKYLHQSIASILNQSFKDFEFVIVDDGSTDKSSDIIKSYNDSRIKYIQQKNQGVANALNKGLNNSSGKYIARMDADDISFQNRLEKQYRYLESNDNVIIVGSHAKVIDKDGNYIHSEIVKINDNELKSCLPKTSPFIHPSIMFRADMLDNNEVYPDVPLLEDVLFFIKISSFGDFANIDEPLLYYRITPEASSRRSTETRLIINRIKSSYYKNRSISNSMIIDLKKSTNKIEKIDKDYFYYLYLSKKYLYDNSQPKLVRLNAKLASKYSSKHGLLLMIYIISFLPFKLINVSYGIIKKKC